MHLRVSNIHNHLEVYIRWEKQFWEAQEPNWWTQPVSGTALILSQVYLTHHLYSYPMTHVAISVQNFLCISLFLFKWELEMRTLIPKQFSSAKYQRARREPRGEKWAQLGTAALKNRSPRPSSEAPERAEKNKRPQEMTSSVWGTRGRW